MSDVKGLFDPSEVENRLVEEGFTYKPEQVVGRCEKFDGEWICVTAVHREDGSGIVCTSVARGKKYKKVIREAMDKAINARECVK